eukprot:403340145
METTQSQQNCQLKSDPQSRIYVVHFIKKQKYIDFAKNELEALAEMFGVKTQELYVYPEKVINIDIDPMIYVYLPSEEIAKNIVKRSVMIQEILLEFAAGDGHEDMHKNIDIEFLRPYFEGEKTMRIDVENLGQTIQQKQKVEIIEKLAFLPYLAKVNLRRPDQVMKIIENSLTGRVHFGIQIQSNRKDKETFYHHYKLRSRPYLGPTSTEVQLAFLMANQGQVKENDFVFDPFVGTGSIALACSYFKCFQYGTDLDYRVVHGTAVGRLNQNADKRFDKKANKEVNIFTNFDFYGFRRPEIVIMDVASMSQQMKVHTPFFDSIICDPPYGVRAKSQQIGVRDKKMERYSNKKLREEDAKNAQNQNLPEEKNDKQDLEEQEEDEEYIHYSMMKQYDVQKLYFDLLDQASKLLRPGGRVVYLFHTDQSLPEEKNKFPEHPDFYFKCSSINNLTKCRARHLITMIRKTE